MPDTVPAVRHIVQPRSQLCWATCILMAREVILNVQNPDITPATIYEAVTYIDGNTPARDRYIRSALERWGLECSNYLAGHASFDQIRHEIDNNRPVMIGFRGGRYSSGHVIIIGGYELRGPTRWCKIYDSAKASVEIMPFRALDELGRDWDATFFLGRRVINI